MILKWLGIGVILAALGMTGAEARVVRLRIDHRETVLNGKAFGAAGPYEKLVGKVEFALDPKLAINKSIVDLDLAPKNAKGEVTVTADFFMLKPADPAHGNHRLFYEVGNRGGKAMLRYFQKAQTSRDPETAAEFGDGALMNQGYTLLWMGWQWDVPEGQMRMDMPVATDHGKKITGLVRANFIPNDHAPTQSLADRNHRAYPIDDPNSPDTMMMVRTNPTDTPTVIPRSKWHFVGGNAVALDGGFELGRIYDVVYRARDPRVVGTGLAGTRDLISFMKHDQTAANPMPGIRYAYGWGVSQSGRFLRHFLYQGFNEDEQGRIVFDGVIDEVGGAGRGSFNHRFGQASRDAEEFFDVFYPVDMFPFTDGAETDPVTGKTDSLLGRAEARHVRPKLFHIFSNSEYFNRGGSLIHTDVTGTRDIAPPPDSRIYFVSSGPHAFGPDAAGQGRRRGRLQQSDQPQSHRAGLAQGHGRVGDGREGAAAEPHSPYRRRHFGADRKGWLAENSRRAFSGALPEDLSPGFRAAMGPGHCRLRAGQGGSNLCRPGAGGGSERQQPGGYPPAGHRSAGGDLWRLEFPRSVDRQAGSTVRRNGFLSSLRPHQGGAAVERGFATVDRRTLSQPRGISGKGHRRGETAGCGAFSVAGG